MLDNSDSHTKTTLPRGIIACSCNAVQTCDVTDRNVAIKCPFEVCSTHNNEKMRGPLFIASAKFLTPESKLLQLVVKLLQLVIRLLQLVVKIVAVIGQNCYG